MLEHIDPDALNKVFNKWVIRIQYVFNSSHLDTKTINAINKQEERDGGKQTTDRRGDAPPPARREVTAQQPARPRTVGAQRHAGAGRRGRCRCARARETMARRRGPRDAVAVADDGRCAVAGRPKAVGGAWTGNGGVRGLSGAEERGGAACWTAWMRVVETKQLSGGGGSGFGDSARRRWRRRRFDLPEEVEAVLPSDPFEQLDIARKITSIALATRVSKLESESSRLRSTLHERDDLIADLQSQIESLHASLAQSTDRLAQADSLKERLLLENASLSNTVKKLNRDVSKVGADSLQSHDPTGLALQLQISTVGSLFLLHSLLPIPLPRSLPRLILSSAFAQEFLHFYLHRKDPSGLENRYFDLMLLPVSLCAVFALLRPDWAGGHARGVGLVMQGAWFVQMGFSFFTD
ncbi:hypothetical protein Syun_029018 [Stephania yunnanensis]|uniref:Uncharacterized protein n=1 Tax=Stephania yunnanensis TaxID=152371 RepID=A0AAP0HGY7_9MAGN